MKLDGFKKRLMGTTPANQPAFLAAKQRAQEEHNRQRELMDLIRQAAKRGTA